ncbi:hypothetical protein GF336_01310 [Candidatus Woesearchaeota archaeon]|nr:hypothetical protein [Candidatus Woesearchaeota archaeon]
MAKNEEFKSYILISVFALLILSIGFGMVNLAGYGNIAGRAYHYEQPTKVYGEVVPSLQDGAMISFKVDGLEIASAQLKDSRFGYDEKVAFKMDNPATSKKEGYAEGDSVDVYIEDIKIAEISYFNTVNEKDITIPASKRAEVSTAVAEALLCKSDWECSEWSRCENGGQTRECIDLNDCRLKGEKPIEKRACEEPVEYTEPAEEIPIAEEEIYGFGNIISVVAAIFVIAFVFIILKGSKKKKR